MVFNNENPVRGAWQEPAIPPRRVAVVGAGPAGLSAASELASMGYRVTAFESAEEPGGMPVQAYTRPGPRAEAKKLVNDVVRAGAIEIRTGITIGRDVTLRELKDEGFSAVVLAPGAGMDRELPIEGDRLCGVMQGLDLLKSINRGEPPPLGPRVAVVGAGNVAMEAAASASGFGARSTTVVCLENPEEMPACRESLGRAEEKGVQILPGWSPIAVSGLEGRATGLTLRRCISVFDSVGRFNPRFDDTGKRLLEADSIVIAIGRRVNGDFHNDIAGIGRGGGGVIRADEVTLQTGVDWIFVAGEAYSGPSSIEEAVESGREAAVSVDKYLRGADLYEGRLASGHSRAGYRV